MLTRCSTAESDEGFCYRQGEVCSKLKRAAEAVADAIALPNQVFEPGEQTCLAISCLRFQDTNTPLAEFKSCHGSSNKKRALDDVNDLLDRILVR